MKRILALLLVLSIMVLTLASCDSNTIEDIIKDRNEYNFTPETTSAETLNVYIVYDGESVNEFSTGTVVRQINQYTESVFNTTLNIFYYTASEYANAVYNNLDSKANRTNQNAPDIVLINSATLYNNLAEGTNLVDLASYISSDKYAGFGLMIDDSLLTSARDSLLGKTLVIPNNQIVGYYSYAAINRLVAEGDLSLSLTAIKSYNTRDKIYTSIPATDETEGYTCLGDIFKNNGINFGNNVKLFTGNYQERLSWEESGWVVNVLENPMGSYLDVYKGCFAVTYRSALLTEEELNSIDSTLEEEQYNATYNQMITAKQDARVDRCMEIIYAFSNDFYLHNLLLYGVKGINYTTYEDGDGNVFVNRVSTGDNVYSMNPLHTGDIFCSYFCNDFGYTPSVKYYGKLQNADAIAQPN